MHWVPIVIFLLSSAFLGYVVVGYPLLLCFLASYFPKPIRKGNVEPAVAVVIPVRNGAQYIRRKLESVLRLDYPREKLEILVVSDGSTDETDVLIGQFASRGIRLLHVPHGGKPAALNAGIPLTHNEIILLTDIRQELKEDSLRRLLTCFADPAVGVVSGELVIRQGDSRAEANIGLYWRFETWMRNRLSDLDSTLGATGPFYAIRRELVTPIPPDTLLDDVYLPLAAFFRGYRLVVEPAAKAYDDPTSLATEFRRKVRTLAGNYQMMRLYPALLTPRNRMWIHYLCYKLGRLLLPYALLAVAITGFWLPAGWMVLLALAIQAVVYGLAAIDIWVPETAFLKRLSSPARTFVVMMIAAVFAVSVFFVSPQTLWVPTKTRTAGSS
jgi:biofilm PGA synthesis N-glycosyltransferase PgaC